MGIKRIFGKALYGLGRLTEIFFNLVIDILEWTVKTINSIKNMAKSIFGGPFILYMIIPLLFRGGLFTIILLFIFVPKILEYILELLIFVRYTLVEYLYDKSDYFIDGTQPKYGGIGDYGREYIRKQEEAKRRAEEARRRARAEEARRRAEAQRKQQEQNERIFWEFFGGNFTGGQGYNGQQQTNMNFGGAGFKNEYEESCDILEVDYNASKDEIRSAYRRMAKKYHPDLSDDPKATEKFQKVNDANTFLNEDNIKRYQSMD